MKKLSLKSKILLGAILMGGTVAGAHTISNIPSAQETRYDWVGEDDAPENPGGTLNNQTVSQAIGHFGCSEGDNECAKGTRVSGTGAPNLTIYFE